MKRILSFLICAVILLGAPTSALAAAAEPMKITCSDIYTNSSEAVLTVALAQDVTDGSFTLSYSAARLTLLEVSSPEADAAVINGPATARGVAQGSSLKEGTITAAFTFAEAGRAGDVLLTCRFRVKSATTDDMPFSIGNITLNNGDAAVDVAELTLNAPVSVPSGSPADSGAGKDENCPSARFADVVPALWYHEAIDFVLNRGLFEGVSDTSFAPDGGMTRAMFVTVLGRLAGIDKDAYSGSSFSDVAVGTWFAPYVEWASKSGIVSGVGGGLFSPTKMITREEMAVILWRYQASVGKSVSVGDGAAFAAFPDSAQVSAWARDAMKWAVERGVIAGSDGKLLPGATATRAQVAQLIKNYCSL